MKRGNTGNTKLLFKLMKELGPSGNEINVRNVIKKEMKKYVDRLYVDKFGNLICLKKGSGTRIMLAAHMDEIGLMVKKIETNGFLRISTVGSLDTISLIGQPVIILNDKNKEICKGMISFPQFHDALDITELPRLEDLYVDAGVDSTTLKRKGVKIGNYMIPIQSVHQLGNEKIISGKAIDDRVGCYALIELARRLKKIKIKESVYFVFTVQEEIGMYGAKTAVWNLKPDWGIAVDATTAKDSELRGRCIIGTGPYVTIKDADMIGNKQINTLLQEIAKEKCIPLQLEVDDYGTTDATSMMLSREGIPSTTISVPVRNIHSCAGICNLNDVEYLIQILYYLLIKPQKKYVN